MNEKEAAERLHTSTEGMQMPDPSGPPWLNQIDTVSGIVRGFLADVTRRFGSLEEKQFMAWLESECLLKNELFLGFKAGENRDDYQRSIWNMPQNLGASIGPNMRFEAETRLAVRDAFMISAAAIIDTVVKNAGLPVSEWGWQMDGIAEALTNGLLGLPVVQDDE